MAETWRQKNAQKNRHSSSFYGSSRKFQSNPNSNPTPSNPNPNPRTANSSSTAPNQLKITNRLQVEEEVEEDSCEPVSIIGTCPFMCPDGERAQRERLRDLAVFERLDGNPAKTSPELAVKKFCRTISTKETRASDLRPLPVLEDTLKYLLNLMDSTKRPFEEVHDFIFDRTRSLRQDLSIQNIGDDQAIWMYEEMVKFHIISQHKLQTCNDNPNISSMRYLNKEQLIKTLMSLLNLYEANQRPNFEHENEAEYYSFYVLLHLSSISQPLGESLSLWFRNVPFNIVKSQHMCFARRVLRLLRMGNYKQFLSAVVTEATYLQYCILEPYINEVRALALSYINNACYKLHPYPLAHLSTVLMMKDSDLESLCNSCGLEIYTDEKGIKFLPPKQTSFRHPKEGFQKYYCLGLDRHERKIPAWGN